MSGTLETIRVLHVDDDPGLAEMVATFLEREDDRIEVRTEHDAEAGLRALADAEVDCVVSDYDMPGLDGIDFLRAVRDDHPDLPFVLFTGKGSEEVASEAISAGVTDYLQKRGGTEQYALLANRIRNAADADRARKLLAERTRRLETLIENLPGMIYRCRNDPKWPMETVEGEVESLTGYAADELERNEVVWGEEVIHPDDRENAWSVVQEAIETDGTFEVTYRIHTRAGETKWLWERGRAVHDDDGGLEVLEGFITDITDRRERERRLERTTTRLEALFENSPDMIDVHDVEGTLLDANPRLCAETGYDESELVGTKVWELDHHLGPDEARDIWREMDVDDRVEIETEFERRDGSTFPVRVHLRRFDIDGEKRFLVSSRNVADRKRRERKLEELRERTRRLNYTRTVEETTRLATEAADEIIGASLTGVHLLNEDGTRLELSAFAEGVPELFDELPGYDRSTEPGTRAHLVWEAFRESESVHLNDVSASSRLTEETPAESVVLHPIGDHGVFVISSAEPNRFTETDVLLVEILANYLEAALDRVAREETLRTREKRLELLHDATRELIRAESRTEIADRVIDAVEDILGFSVAVVRLYESEENGLVPVASSEAVSDVVPEREVYTSDSGSLNWAAYEAGEVRVYDDIEAEGDALDQGTGLRSLMLLPMGEHGTLSIGELTPNAFDSTDEFLARILSTAAETALDERERERELRRSRDELKRQNERLEEFADVVSHDLRNPLTVAEGRLRLVEDECDSEHLADVARAHDRMNDLIGDLLTLAREGEELGELEIVDLADLIEGCWVHVERPPGARLRVDVDRTVRADRTRLQQLFENLLRNSVEHGSTGSRIPPESGDSVEHGRSRDGDAVSRDDENSSSEFSNHSTSSRPRADDSVEHGSTDSRAPVEPGDGVTITVGEIADGFYVEDDGVGIPRDAREDVFGPGYSTDEDGTGFGLSIVKRVVEAHGWEVRIADGTDGGARFEVTGVEFEE
ncbi:hybrid sensor histidine kinase/response regulator [Halorubrum cibi]|uniref:histidine kinase n=1 Tax=Halorubrum cibi TaxID=413815 RepID=A0A521C996_9EURY|nr:PAS domain S-box protein [Halorubrum cibi]SMO55381.1 PAS domain S-box-containing protein [Halorubrum cibi]